MKCNDLTVKQLLFITQYLQLGNVEKCAKEIGINPKTAFVWLKQDTVKKEIEKRLNLMTDKAMKKLQLATEKATAYLSSVIDDENLPPIDRIRASDIILKNAVKAYEIRAVEKLNSLENILQEVGCE